MGRKDKSIDRQALRAQPSTPQAQYWCLESALM